MKGKIQCEHSTLDIVDKLKEILEKIEKEMKTELVITSGVRCPVCNEKAGGKPNSAHLTGEAVDVLTPNGSYGYYLLQSAIKNGILRIGFHKEFTHLDIAKHLPNPVRFLY